MKLRKKVLGIAIFINSLFLANSAYAANWVNIGKDDGDIYYVDVENETTKDSIWKAPVKLIGSDETNFGELNIDCSDYTARLIVSTYDDDWYDITPDSPEDFVGRKVCN